MKIHKKDQYITADSTGTDTAKVTLRVGLIPSDGNTTLRKAAKNRDETAASYCSVSGFVYNIYGEGSVEIQKGGCDDLDICENPLPVPSVKLKKVPALISYDNPNPCEPNKKDSQGKIIVQSGGFLPLYWKNRQDISASACLSDDGSVQYKMLLNENNQTVNELKPEYVLEICNGNISQANWLLINNVTHMINILNSTLVNNMPTDNTTAEIKKFEHDIKAARKYGSPVIKYIFEPVVLAHENRHKYDYDSALVANKEKLLDQKIRDYKITCEDYKKPYDEAQILAEVEFLGIVKEYIEDVIDNSYKNFYNRGTKKDNENFVQNRPEVQKEVDKFENALSNFKKQYGIK